MILGRVIMNLGAELLNLAGIKDPHDDSDVENVGFSMLSKSECIP
jgi:hypothetical protein